MYSEYTVAVQQHRSSSNRVTYATRLNSVVQLNIAVPITDSAAFIPSALVYMVAAGRLGCYAGDTSAS